MRQSIRWIPAKTKSLGQTATVVNTNEPPAPVPVPAAENNPAVMNSLLYGGLILAGLALAWAVMSGPASDQTRSWE